MNLLSALSQSLVEVRHHWFRSLLTIIGIMMGVSSLLTMQALTEGAVEGLRQLNRESGIETKLQVYPAPVPAEQLPKAGQSTGLIRSDAEIIRKLPYIRWASPVLTFSGERVSSGTKETTETRLYAAELDLQTMDRIEVIKGRWLTDLDLESKQAVCVLGWKVAAALFDDPERDAVGSLVTIRGVNYTVVGLGKLVLSQTDERLRASGRAQKQEERRKQRGSTWDDWDPFWWKNHFIAIPITLAHASQSFANPGSNSTYIREIQFGFDSGDQRAAAQNVVERALLAAHNGIRDFKIQGNEKDAMEYEQMIHRQRLTGGIIAGISLLVGALGIVNIMLASVADRVRELGIRLAVGARGRDLFVQVLGEAIVLSFLAGLLGLGVGMLILRGLEAMSPEQNVPIIRASAIAISMSSAVAIGFLAGLFPAWKAMQVTVIEALKAE